MLVFAGASEVISVLRDSSLPKFPREALGIFITVSLRDFPRMAGLILLGHLLPVPTSLPASLVLLHSLRNASDGGLMTSDYEPLPYSHL